MTDRHGRRFVLRRPPLGHVLATAHDMAREHKIISAVGTTDVPVPKTLGLCADDSVNQAPFYVMDFVDGIVLDSPEKGAELSIEQREAVAFDLVDVLADLHAIDVDAVGLGDLARREGYVERQVKRWTRQWADSRTRDLPEIDEVAYLLAHQFLSSIRFRSLTAIIDLETASPTSIATVLLRCSTGSYAPLVTRWLTLDISVCIGQTLRAMVNARTTQRVPEDSLVSAVG